jgi:hypothetical protein
MRVQQAGGLAGCVLLIGLTAWALLMIAPDLYRVVDPLASAGFAADNDGRIYDVRGPFPQEADSPAWKAGLRVGDRIDLTAMRCLPSRGVACVSLLSVLGGMGGTQLVRPGRVLALTVLPADGGGARTVTVAPQRPLVGWLSRFVLLLNEIAGIAFVLAAAWLVWTQPSAMSWGFFLYAIWFNPGQNFVYFLLLQEHPPLVLTHELAAALAHGAACSGFLLFALRFPGDQSEPRWQNVRRGLPALGAVIAGLHVLSSANAFGYPTETVARATFVADYGVDAFAVLILLRRQRGQPPQDYQRMRWVIWGCLIGLPAFLIAELASTTTIFVRPEGNFTPSEDIVGLLYLVNGLLCLFVFEALRRSRVVNVMIPLRRVTILGLTLSVPILFLHRQVEIIEEYLDLPGWAWIFMGAVAVYLLSRLHEGAVHLADHYFNRPVEEAEKRIKAALHKAKKAIEIDRLLADETFKALKLASAAAFRREGPVYRRDGNGKGWDGDATTIKPDAPMLAPVMTGKPFALHDSDEGEVALPGGLARPVLAVPAINPARCFAVSFYGPHQSGTDLDASERAMLARLGAEAAAMYAELENGALRDKVARLERELRAAPKNPER